MDLRLQLEGNKNKKSINKDVYQRLKFENTSILIPMSDINDTINTYKYSKMREIVQLNID